MPHHICVYDVGYADHNKKIRAFRKRPLNPVFEMTVRKPHGDWVKRISLQIGSIKAYDRPKYYRHSDTFLISREPALDKDPLVKNIFQEIERLLYTVLERRYSFSLRSGRTEENQSYEEIYEALPSEYKDLISKEEQRLTQAYQETMQRALTIRQELQSSYTKDTARFLEEIYRIAQSFK